MATYTFSRVIFGVDGTQDVTTADTVNYSITGGGLAWGSIVHNATNCTVTVGTNASGANTETGTITFSGTGSYSVTWTQLDDKFESYQVTLSGTVTAGTQAPDLTVTFSDVATGGTSLSNRTLGGGTNGENYRLVRTYSGTATVNQVVDTITNYNSSTNTTFDISSTYMPAEGRTAWYKVQAQRPTNASPPGDGTWQDTNISGTTSAWIRKQNTVPTFTISDNDAAAANVTIKVNITNNSAETPNSLRVAQVINGVVGSEDVITWVGNGLYTTGITQPRNIGSDEYKYRVRVFVNGVSGTTAVPNEQVANSSPTGSIYYSPAYDAGYIAPDTAVSPVSTTIASGATSASIVINNVTSGEEYQLRNQTGQTQYQSAVASGTSVTISQTSGLPPEGVTYTYVVYSRRPTSVGGDNLYDNTNDTYTIERTAAGPTAPTDISFSAPTTQSNIISVACTASGGSGETLQVSENQTTWVANGSSFTFTRGTAKTIYARRSGGTGTSSTYSESHTPAYLLPDRNITFSVSDPVIASSFEDNVILTINNGSAGSAYRALRTTGGNLGCGNTGYLTGTSGTVTIGDAANELPPESTTYSYTIQAQKSVSTGGNGSTWYTVTSSPSTFTIERQAAPTYFVDVSAFFETEPGFEGIFMSVSGTGYRSSAGTALQLQPGDKVGFRDSSSAFSGTITATNFASTHWTSATSLTLTSSYQYKTAKTGIPVSTADEVILTASQSASSQQRSSYYIGQSLTPDTTISLDKDVYSISTSATSHTIIISNSGSSTNASITEYRVTDGTTTHESRTGHGSLTVTDVPPNAGFPKDYSIQARVTTANGGSGIWLSVPDSSYEVIASTTASSNDPTIDNYGLVIYDHQSNPVTSFTSGHTLLRKIYAGTANLSTSTTTTVNTGISGLSSNNSVVLLEGTGTVAASTPDSVPTTFSGSSVVFGRAQSAGSVDFTIGQYSGSTLGATETYGFLIRNGNSDIVLDENSIVYGVKEILNVATSAVSTFQNSYIYWVYIQLAQGAYPSSSGVPIPALACTSSVLLVPPRILSTLWPDGSYRYVGLVLSKSLPLSAYNVAMLVSSEIATPSYYGGTNSNYGARIFDSSGNTTWDSQWRQAIVNNVVDANQFTTGTNQNGNYDVTTGYDGVTAPLLTNAQEFDFGLSSTSQNVTISSGLNEMDPAYTYVMGPAVTGKVSYYMGKYEDPEFNIDGYRGGGLHVPAIRINSTSSATINMFRYSDGPIPNNNTEWGARVPTSYHPQGQFILVRVV